MITRRSTLVAAAALPLAALTLAFAPAADAPCTEIPDAATADPEDTIAFCEATGYFSSANPAKADNLAVTGATDFATWTDAAPASVTTGSGAGYLSQYQTSLVIGPGSESGVTYVGDFTGAIDSIAIEQYAFTAADEINGQYGIVLTLTIDDRLVYESDFVAGDLAPIEAGGDAVDVFRFAVTDIFADAATRDGDHTIEVNITPYFVGDEAVYVYGAAEAPSSITFNATDLAGFARISARNG